MKKTLIKTFTGVMAVTAVVGAMAITSNAAEVPEQMTSETTASVETVAEVQDANPFHRLARQAHDMVAQYNAMGQGDVIDDQFVVDEGWGDVIDDQFAYVEGQGDVIDDQFVYVEGQGDVIDDQFVVDEGWGDVIDDQFAYVEGQGDVIDDQFAYVEGQGDVIDDQFVVDEGWGDVIDDQFVYVEGQGDVIDDEFAVVEATDVAENTLDESMPSAPTVLAVGSADSEQNKSGLTDALERINMPLNPLNTVYGKPICETIDNCDALGHDEKELGKVFVKTGLGILWSWLVKKTT